MKKTIILFAFLCSIPCIIKAQKNVPFKGDNGKYGIKNEKDSILLQPAFDFILSCRDSLASARMDGLYGVIDLSGNWVIPPGYSFLTIGSDLYYAETKTTTTTTRYLINKKNEVFASGFYKYQYLSHGWIKVYNGYYDYNLIHTNGQKVFETNIQDDVLKLDSLNFDSKGIATIALGFNSRNKQELYVVNNKGEVLSMQNMTRPIALKDKIILQPYVNSDNSKNQLLLAIQNGSFGYVDSNYAWVVPPNPNLRVATPFKNGRSITGGYENGKYKLKYIDQNGNNTLPAALDGISDIEIFNDVAIIRKPTPNPHYLRDSVKFFNVHTWNEFFPKTYYSKGSYMGENLFIARREEYTIGFDHLGNILFTGQFDSINSFNNGLARVSGIFRTQYKSKYYPKGYGFLDLNGKCHLCYELQQATDFIDGYALIFHYDGERSLLIDTSFKTLFEPGKDYIAQYNLNPGGPYVEITKAYRYYYTEKDSIFHLDKKNGKISFYQTKNNPYYVKKPDYDLASQILIDANLEFRCLSKRELKANSSDTKPFELLGTPVIIKFTKYNITIVESDGKTSKHTIEASKIEGDVKRYLTYSDYVIEVWESPKNGTIISIRNKNILEESIEYCTKNKLD